MQGRLAAKRLAGYAIEFPGVLDAGGCKMFDMTITATGLTESNAARETFTSACNPDISSEPSAEPITIAAEQALQKLKAQ